ncbi:MULTISPECIES: naringenin-chalcone synthase [unclassified Nostoc]|uniref:type III polyketide synthase n=1 Tax=unclassified Nostoc TaxID=2593658 RepID=UPI002AD59DF8|nr:naringenin-chalcone synthase [Nostoc sp. DedQUE03]MDZ7974523.1 naringenin-chalcone synthase [Nostoc sp. DedQUE03]MDZ8047073.1 naringenin-chalcone synthase [Nostoc sp. DedQUE02]
MNTKKTLVMHNKVNNLPVVKPTEIKNKYSSSKLGTIRLKQFLPIIESIATGTPDNIVQQSDAAGLVANIPRLEQNRCRIDKLYKNTRIDTRHLAVNLLSNEAIAHGYSKTIQSRMQMYQEFAVPLAERVAKKALLTASESMKTNNHLYSDMNIEDHIRLIVFVSSTGFVAPGIDTELIKSLGLRRDTARVTVNFMGCAAAMNGLRVASDHVRANPTHKVLVVCLELSSINAVFEDEMNDVIIHSIFGDGCAAVVVGACQPEQAIGQGKVVIRDHLSYLVEDTEDGIVLGIRDNGITCQLSRQLPDYIKTGVNPIIERFLASHELTKENIDLWAIHPGGTRIIQNSQDSLGLTDSQVADSWEILRQYGNMLSPSVLFVMERMLFSSENNSAADKEYVGLDNPNHHWKDSTEQTKALTGIAFSFSPGVGIEGILFQKV